MSAPSPSISGSSSTSSIFENLSQQWQAIDQSWAGTNSFVSDLIMYCQSVESHFAKENERLQQLTTNQQLDLEDAQSTRRKLQIQVHQYEREIANYRAQEERYKEELQQLRQESALQLRRTPSPQEPVNTYIIALIDGDGLLFKENYVRAGLSGGKEAARDFHAALREKCGIYNDSIRVEAKIFTNVSGLAKVMKATGAVNWESELKEFMIGFTQAVNSFDVIDVGMGKERADSKIRDLARWHAKNTACKQIYLGISHDSGYTPLLDELLATSPVEKFCIIEGFPTHRALIETGVPRYNMTDRLFRDSKLSRDKETIVGNESPTTTFNDFVRPEPTRGCTPPPVMKVAIPASKKKERKPSDSSFLSSWSPGPRGLDPPTVFLPSFQECKKKLCAKFYLLGVCPRGVLECPFDHKHKPKKEELMALEYWSRTVPCSYKQGCENSECVHGHHCPSMKGDMCMAPRCRFSREMHPPGTKFRPTYTGGDSAGEE